MHPSLKPYEERVDLGFIRRVDRGDLVLYNYTDHCTYEKAWDEYTRNARGIVFHKDTGKVIARPFPKFFNLGETQETMFKNLPSGGYTVAEKMDGSLGVIYFHDGEWQVNTRGSFTSDQAIEGLNMLRGYDMSRVPENLTLLAEIIYPSNKIVVNYGDERKLVLLGARITESGKDVSSLVEHLGTGMEVAPRFDLTIPQMIELQKTLPKDKEGFVVYFHENDLRVKIKGDEYMKIAKLLADLSPLSIWENMYMGKVKREVLEQIPEEYRNEWEPIRDKIEDRYNQVLNEVNQDIETIRESIHVLKEWPKFTFADKDERAKIGLFTKEKAGLLKHPGGVFPVLMRQEDKYIMKLIRPTGNKL